MEFINQTIKDIKDEKYLPFDFILFFTSKDEVLKIEETSGEIYIEKISRQISSFEDFENKLYNYLNVENIREAGKNFKKGIIVIDNVENLHDEEKIKIFNFIRRTPRNIQFLITSRDEEPCDEKLNIKEFKDKDKGTEFVNEFIKHNNLDIQLSEEQVNSLINASKGNTLIIVISLLSLNDGKNSIPEIVSDLQFVDSRNFGTIANFMYKNTFDRCILELESEGYEPKKVIRVISLYDEPIDSYSMSKLTKISISDLEFICKKFINRLILEKQGELYVLNEFANSFIFIKLLPNRLETKKLISKIKEHKKHIKQRLDILEERKMANQNLKRIMADWKPRNYVDIIAIAEVYSLYDDAKRLSKNRGVNMKDVQKVVNIFKNNERISTHPYIKFQKARVYSLFLNMKNKKYYSSLVPKICSAYEDAIENIQFSYSFTRNSESHGSLLWIYGLFLEKNLNDLEKSTRHLEDARDILKEKVRAQKNYYSILGTLSFNYFKLFEKTNDRAYTHRCKSTHLELVNNSKSVRKSGYDYEKYLRGFNNVVKKNLRGKIRF